MEQWLLTHPGEFAVIVIMLFLVAIGFFSYGENADL
jgi:hypothetical protein